MSSSLQHSPEGVSYRKWPRTDRPFIHCEP